VLRARPVAVQLRAKELRSGATLELLRELRRLTSGADVALFANDRPDLALLAGADGVHLGQDDLPLEQVRRAFPGLQIGLSTHNLAELERALALRPDYVAFGPVFATSTKVGAEPVVGAGLTRNAARLARSRGVPLVAIGGIDVDNVSELVGDVACVAVIGALVGRDGQGVRSGGLLPRGSSERGASGDPSARLAAATDVARRIATRISAGPR